MAIIYTVDPKFNKFLKGNLKTFKKSTVDRLAKEVKSEVLELLSDGISPTQDGKFKATYSDRYMREIRGGKHPGKTISPVNLKLTGKLYNSLSIRKKSDRITLSFKDKVADKHDKGLAPLPVRRLLPNRGERFYTTISLKIYQIINNELRKLARRVSD